MKQEPSYRFGDCVFDPGARALTRSAQPVPLPGRALDLLGALLEERPRALGKAELTARLWPGTFVSRTSLAQLVTQLRKAIGDDTASPRYIRTVFGHGYAWMGAVDEGGGPAADPGGDCWVRCHGADVGLRPGSNPVGRASDATVRLRSERASRRQAVIHVAADGHSIEDLGSRNGTYVNGRRLTGTVRLQDGDEIVVGDEVMVFCAMAAGTTQGGPRD